MTTDAEQPVLADDASNPVTTLALAPEEKPATTIVLEHQRIALQGLMAAKSPALLAQFSSNAPSAVIDISPSQPNPPAFSKPSL